MFCENAIIFLLYKIYLEILGVDFQAAPKKLRYCRKYGVRGVFPPKSVAIVF